MTESSASKSKASLLATFDKDQLDDLSSNHSSNGSVQGAECIPRGKAAIAADRAHCIRDFLNQPDPWSPVYSHRGSKSVTEAAHRMRQYLQNWDQDFKRYGDGSNPQSQVQETNSVSSHALPVSEVGANISGPVTSVAPAEIPYGNWLWRRLSSLIIPVERNAQVSGIELSVAKSSTKEGFSPQPIYTASMQPSSTKGASQPRTTRPEERSTERIQSYLKAAKHISETFDEASVPIISTEPPLSRLTSAQNNQPDEYMDDSDSSATLSSSRSTLSSSTTSILSADGSIGLPDEETSFSREIAQNMDDLEQKNKDGTEPFLEPLGPAEQTVVDRVMEEFWAIFNQQWASGFSQHAGDSASGSGPAQDWTSSPQTRVEGASSRKRKGRDEEDPNRNSRKRRPPPSKDSMPGEDLDDQPKFACPFRKNNPSKYNILTHRVCADSSWPTIARLKEHLYRKHRITEQPEGLTEEMERSLRSRKGVYQNQTEENRWRDIYKILFPNQEAPSPYFEPIQDETPLSPDSRDLASYEEHLRCELPSLVRSRIEDTLRLDRQAAEPFLVAGLFETIQICQDTLYRLYCKRLDQPQGVAASENASINATNDIPVSFGVSDVNVGGRLDTRLSDFLSAAFQPIPTMPNADLLPNPDNFIGQPGQLQTIADASSSNSVFPLDSGYDSDSPCNCPGLCSTHADTSVDPNYSIIAREMYHGPEVELDMYGQPFREPDWEFDTGLGGSNTYPRHNNDSTDRHYL